MLLVDHHLDRVDGRRTPSRIESSKQAASDGNDDSGEDPARAEFERQAELAAYESRRCKRCGTAKKDPEDADDECLALDRFDNEALGSTQRFQDTDLLTAFGD